MLIAHVHIKVKSNLVENFKKATLENARNSILESGIERFDVLQSDKDETAFVLMEVYRTVEDQIKHKETSHFKRWVETVEEMMDSPRYAITYSNVFPNDQGWT